MPVKPLSVAASIATVALGLQTNAMAGVVISGDYYEQTPSVVTCLTTYECRLNFTPIPSDKFLDIQNINCAIYTEKPLLALRMGSSSSNYGSSGRELHYPFQFTMQHSGTYYYVTNQQINYRIGASPYLYFYARTTEPGQTFYTCTVTGKLSPR